MNKTSALLLVTAIIGSTGAIAGWHGNGKDRMHEYWNMKMEQWNTAINKQNAKTKTEAKKLLEQVEAKHDEMVAEFKKIDTEKIKRLRKDKHALMNKLDKMLGLKTTREKIHEKAREVKAKIKSAVKPMETVTIVAEEADMTPVMVQKS